LYRGVIAWNRTRKRNQWGQHHQTDRPATDWINVEAPDLAIVSGDAWDAAHARIAAASAMYRTSTKGRSFGRPARGNPSKYLLTNLLQCGCCGGSLKVLSRTHGAGRKFFYGCAGYHDRGRAVCTNKADAPMMDTDEILIEAVLDDALDETMIADAVEEGVRLLRGDDVPQDRLGQIDRQIASVEQERGRLVTAIASGGQLSGLLEALREREERRRQLEGRPRDARSPEAAQRVGVGPYARRADRAGHVLATRAHR
jgi:hypothetical protein